MIQVMNHGIQVNFQYGAMWLFLQKSGNVFKLKRPGAFDQDDLVIEIIPFFLTEKMLRVFIESGISGKIMTMFTQVFTDPDEQGYICLAESLGNRRV